MALPLLVCRHQAFIPAPVTSIWTLIGQPSSYAEWWPQVIEVQGRRFGPGCSSCDVSEGPEGATDATFEVEAVEELKELLVHCRDTGLGMRWLLAEAQDGTFVDAEFRVDQERAAPSGQVDYEAAKRDLRGWLQTSLDGLADAAALSPPAGSRMTSGISREVRR